MWWRRRAVPTPPGGSEASRRAGASGGEAARRGGMDATAAPHGSESPSPWVARFAAGVPPGSRVLDLACGRGRHARLFAEQGCLVDAVDIDAEAGAALQDVRGVRFLRADLEGGPWPYAGRRFDAVVVTNYLHRPLLPLLAEALAPGGMLIYETFMAGHERFGRPTNPAFLLRPRELLDAFGATLAVIAFEEGVVSQPRPARISRICAVRAGGDAHLRLDADV
jgi:SAM-dependent methyltransferase